MQDFRFDYVKKTPDYTEYDGLIVQASNEDEAWDIFLSCTSEYGLPNYHDYKCVKL